MRWKIWLYAGVSHRVRVLESHVEFKYSSIVQSSSEYSSIAWSSSSTRIVYYVSPKPKLDYSRVSRRVRVTIHSLLDREILVTRQNNASECDITLELYCIMLHIINKCVVQADPAKAQAIIDMQPLKDV